MMNGQIISDIEDKASRLFTHRFDNVIRKIAIESRKHEAAAIRYHHYDFEQGKPMSVFDIPLLHLKTAYSGPLHHLEQMILSHVMTIEGWFRKRWQETPPPITSSVDLRHAGFKLAPVDTNLFPAGFNNLNLDFLPLCVQAVQATMINLNPNCTRVLIIPEMHTRNQFYHQSLCRLRDMVLTAGFDVRVASLAPDLTTPQDIYLDSGEKLHIEPLIRQDNVVGLSDFTPCLLLLNNDLSSGTPEILQGIHQMVEPPVELGWALRSKSTHFSHFNQVATEFSQLIGIDPWSIHCLFKTVENVDFMSKEGLDRVAHAVDVLLMDIRQQYQQAGIQEKPFVVVKSDNGTYGMGVMMVHDGAEILQMNRKQRTKMSSGKGSQAVTRVIVQEGVLSLESMPNGAVAEPVVYMFGQYVIGGFYRVHQGRGRDESLNAPGMHFEPLAFQRACNTPYEDLGWEDKPNRFYVYGVIARLAALAAARERKAVKDKS
jgi:glutamate--cysteine ligase